MSDHKQVNEPDNPNNGVIYIIGFLTLAFLFASIVGLKILHEQETDRIYQEYDKEKSKFKEEHDKKEKENQDSIDKVMEEESKK